MKKKIYKNILLFITIFLLIIISISVANEYIEYSVKPGDSLYKISQIYDVPIIELRKTNNIWTDTIFIGQSLLIPVIHEDNNDKYVSYTVKPGDSLYLISRRYNTTINRIKNINNLSGNIIFIGQTLLVPESVSDDTNNKQLYSVSGRVDISNRTHNHTFSSQENKVTNPVLPLKKNEFTANYRENQIIIKYKPVFELQDVNELEKANNLVALDNIETKKGRIVNYEIPEEEDLLELIDEYKSLDGIEWVEPNYIFYPASIPSDEYYNRQWNFININMEAAWDVTKGNENVVVAVLDTGIIPEHPDLKDNLLPGVNFVGGNNSYPIENYSITDTDPTDYTTFAEGGSHGTHVAGIIGALTNNNIGVAGINWDVNILPVKVLNRSGGSSWDVAEGIYYAIDKNVDIINMSLGSNHKSYLQEDAIKEAYNNEITIIAATGNEGSSVYYPAAFPETIAVGAVDSNNDKTSYSNYGPEVDLVAPGGGYGEGIYSTWGYYENENLYSSYNYMIGTSMAAPHVSGIAALLTANGIIGPEKIRERLINTSIDLGNNVKDDNHGYGLVDAYGALLGKKIASPVVFAASIKDNNIIIKSEIKESSKDGSFKLNQIENNNCYLVAWRDINNNNIIDAGDYFGISGAIDFNNNTNLQVIKANYISDISLNTSYNIINN